MSQTEGLDFIVDKSAWEKSRFVETEVSMDLAPGQVLFRVDRFAFTANNISYALAGEFLRYWYFFPKEEGWGCLPTMGFGDVVASTHSDVAIGTRCFGFFPMSKYLLIEPASANAGSIVDGVEHRQSLAPAYNQYQPVANDPLYSAAHEDELALLRGLFLTSFLAEDFLADSDLHGADSVVISSASSKTSIALAFVVAQKGRAQAVGLTSARNRGFVESLGFYDEVRTYDEIGTLPADTKSVFVDMAGDAQVTRAVHEHFGNNLVFSQRIGGTHWDAGGDDSDIPGPERQFFFAPGQIKKRLVDWGPQGFQERLGSALQAFVETSGKWLHVERGYGREEVERVYNATLAGSADPAVGNILSLWENEDEASGPA
jgi:hypothetical protein